MILMNFSNDTCVHIYIYTCSMYFANKSNFKITTLNLKIQGECTLL